ncbi:FecCD family ABC transporter permease [Amycolatopsis azurea]|uniref:Heme ABC transporter permease n=1 Tax=Amycolatopsis azurea DSM 43854 TaxID=1238180 RepID=M2NWZ4_9PSEU|nr:iron ABC transporter permease [Amycolatopsis azurea]EMD27114.1 Heme ABC transporter, permease protein HmuU [Amycolatopsis azurea DSM 43854]OOC08678.1 heme ABC transporter permease [Amycolatopsis azurea DSM 43854]
MNRGFKVTAVFAVLIAGVVAISLVSAGSGQFGIPLSQVFDSVLDRLGLTETRLDPFAEGALWQVRFPRVVMTLLVGGVLGVCGAVMQGVFGNPLAEPAVVGVSSGAAVGASLSIVAGWTFFGAFTTPALGFAGGLVTTLLVYVLSRSRGRSEVVTLILTGVAVNAVTMAIISFLMFSADQAAREQIVFWQLGSLAGSRWPYVVTVLPLVAVGVAGSIALSRKLDLLALGERQARHLGVDVEKLRLGAVVIVALMAAAAVSYSGIIGFVGLIVPHGLRMLLGPGHRVLIPASLFGGALLLAAADLGARTLFTYADLPIGMLTALVGGPFFFWLLLRTRRRSGGWA